MSDRTNVARKPWRRAIRELLNAAHGAAGAAADACEEYGTFAEQPTGESKAATLMYLQRCITRSRRACDEAREMIEALGAAPDAAEVQPVPHVNGEAE